jgi:hypothetical protein
VVTGVLLKEEPLKPRTKLVKRIPSEEKAGEKYSRQDEKHMQNFEPGKNKIIKRTKKLTCSLVWSGVNKRMKRDKAR